jgi:hypothetical protein
MNRISIGLCRRFLILFLCALLAVTAVTAQGQTGEVRGALLSAATKEPLIGANVIVQGTMKGATTDFEGAFAIKGLNPGKYVLVVRFLGYFSERKNIEITTGQVVEANFLLQQDVLKTDEVVITGLSGTIPRGQLGNSIAKVSGSELKTVPVTSALDALVGKVAGMSVSKST